jgi:hypothetical protein
MKWPASILVMTAALIAPEPVTAQVPASTAPRTQTKSTAPTLMPAVDRGDIARVQVLLAQGADPNEFEVIRGAFGPGFTSKSPLLLAVKRNDEPMVRLLLAQGARARWRDANGMTVAEVARSRKINDSLIELLSNAEKRDFSLIPEWPLPEPLALAALQRVAGTKNGATAGERLDSKLLRRVGDIVEVLRRTWTRPKDRPPVLAWSLTRDVNSLEWAIQNGSNEVLTAVVADLDTKRQDCLSSPDGAFGEIKISVRTLLTDGTERRGLRIRYIERFYWDLLPTVPAVAGQWKELAATTSVVAEPLTAGDYMIVARSADGKDLSEAKPISVSRNRTAQFDVSLR